MSDKSFEDRALETGANVFTHQDWVEAMKARPEPDADAPARIDLASDTFPCAKTVKQS